MQPLQNDLKNAAEIFRRFKSIYGQKWTRDLNDDKSIESAINEWALAISGLSAAQIDLGIQKCRGEFIWPPSIAEFIERAKLKNAANTNKSDFDRRPEKRIRNTELALATISEIKKYL